MANADSPFGLRPVRKAGSAYVTGGGNLYHVAVGDAQVIAPGDPVTVTGTGDAFGIPDVTRSTDGATEEITGIMLGIANGEALLDGTGGINFDTTLNTVTLTSQYILVEDDPSVTYEVQVDGDMAATDLQSTADLIAGAPEQGKSTWEVDSTSFDTGVTGQVRILRVKRVVDNELGEFNVVEVLINLPTNIHNNAGV